MFRLLRSTFAVIDADTTYVGKWTKNETWDIKTLESSATLFKRYKGFGTNLYNILSDSKLTASFDYDDVVFHDDNPKHLQLWNGWAANMLPSVDMEKIKLTVDFIKEVFCSNDDKIYNYFMGWVRYILDNPGALTQKAFILISEQGTGKTTLCDNILMPLFGVDFGLSTSRLSSVIGDKNASRENKVFVFVDELINDDNDRNQAMTKKDWAKLKAPITNKTYDLRKMYHDIATNKKNVNNFIFATNQGSAVSLEDSDRRYCILDVNNKYMGNVEYWKCLNNEINTEGYHDALYTYIMNNESFKNGFKVKDPVIETNTRKTLLEANRSQIKSFLLSPGGIPKCGYIEAKPEELNEFYSRFREYTINNGTDEKYIIQKSSFISSMNNYFKLFKGSYIPKDRLLDELEQVLNSEDEDNEEGIKSWDDLTIPNERFNIDEYIKEHMNKISMFMEGASEKQIRTRFIYYLNNNDYNFEKNNRGMKVAAYK